MKRKYFLEEAEKCICGDRDRDYGSPHGSFDLIGKLWSAYMGIEISAKDVAILMALLKVARCKHSNKLDSFVDLAGYAACAGEVATYDSDVEDALKWVTPEELKEVLEYATPKSDSLVTGSGKLHDNTGVIFTTQGAASHYTAHTTLKEEEKEGE